MAVLFSKPFNFRWMMLSLMTILGFLLVLVQFYAVPSEVSSTYKLEVLFPLKIDLPTVVSTSLNAPLNQNHDSNDKSHLETYDTKFKDGADRDKDETSILENEDDGTSTESLMQQNDRMIKSGGHGLSSNQLSNDSESEIVMEDSHSKQDTSHLLAYTSSMNTIKGTVVDSYMNRSFVPVPSGKSDWRNESAAIEKLIRRMRGPTITFSEINSMLLKTQPFSNSERTTTRTIQRKGSALLLSAKSKIKNAPIKVNDPELHPDLFRNLSMFKRSYELMERTLKIYIYKDGEKPVFHQPRLRGIYSSEGWFMKLLETNRRYTVRDPRKAHLFYLPFSSESLRQNVGRLNGTSLRKLESYLKDYVDSIRSKYRFWNRTGGADHFFVGCHDWAPRITRQYMSNCIQALCNANIARGFTLGKDVSVPVTYIRSGNNPTRDIGGNPASERNILAFFAGGMHGYLRPILLQYWGNTNNNRSSSPPDMKIFGPMERTVEGKAVYRNYMKTSKYCVCARGYGVHTPRVVESIYYECVPVIISDNYVPPLFEVLDWSGFSVFVLEKDVPSLRDILVSIPESRYVEMQRRVRMVRRHFLWHKVGEKYDLFHMILHSIWFNRVFQS